MISASSQVVITLERRRFLEASLAGLMLPLAAARAEAQSHSVVFEHDLPNLMMDGWQVTVVEVITPPGPGSHRHQHPGFVLGYEASMLNGHGLGGRTPGMNYYLTRSPDDRPHGMAPAEVPSGGVQAL